MNRHHSAEVFDVLLHSDRFLYVPMYLSMDRYIVYLTVSFYNYLFFLQTACSKFVQ